MATTDTSVAIGILQAAIVAIPFWLTSTQYWLRQSYDPGDSRFRLPSVFLGISNAVGLLALLLAVRYSTDAVLADAGDDVIIAIRLIDLFTFVAFAMLIGAMGNQMAADDSPRVAFTYSMIFTILAPAIILVYIFGFGWLIVLLIILLVVGGGVYRIKIRPWIVARTRNETADTYPELLAATMSTVYRVGSRTSGPLSQEEEAKYREALDHMGFGEEVIDAAIDYLQDTYAEDRE